MFRISGLFFVLGGLLSAIIVMVLMSNWNSKKRKCKYIRGPWKDPKNFEVPSTGILGEIIRGPESWYRDTIHNGGDVPNA